MHVEARARTVHAGDGSRLGRRRRVARVLRAPSVVALQRLPEALGYARGAARCCRKCAARGDCFFEVNALQTAACDLLAAGLTMARFLVVDDDHITVHGMTRLLTDDGHEVTPFTAGG